MSSELLRPQRPILDIKNSLLSHSLYVNQQTRATRLFNQRISEKDLRILRDIAKTKSHQIRQDKDPNNNSASEYTWTQDGNTIIITCPFLDFQTDHSINITNTKVESHLISGNWFEPVDSFSYTIDTECIKIFLKVKSQWPVLILGGKMDRLSLYLLALLANCEMKNELFEHLLSIAAHLGHLPSLTNLGMLYAFERDHFMACYWFIRGILEHNDSFSVNYVCERLLLDENDPHSQFLAENLLIKAAKEGEIDVYKHLGYLYLADYTQFKGDDALALRYFLLSSALFQNQESLDAANALKHSGISVPSDILASDLERAVSYINTTFNNHVNRPYFSPLRSNDEDEFSFVKSFVDIGTAVVCAVGLVALSEYLRRKK